MKKALVAFFVATLVCGVGLARPNGGGPAPKGGPRPNGRGPAPHQQRAPERPRSHDRAWGRGGRNFWPGFIGGLVGSTLTRPVPPPPRQTVVTTQVVTPTVVTTPVVMTTPVVVTPTTTVVTTPTSVQSVWVEGRYVDQVDAAGRVVRVWQPGHYESVVR